MKIAHVITRVGTGGAEENTVLTCNAQVSAGHQVSLFLGDSATDPAMLRLAHPAITKIVIREMLQPIRPWADVKAILAIARVLRTLKPDIVHTHMSKAGVLGRFAARLAGAPVVVHTVHILAFLNVGPVRRATYLVAERLAARFTDAFIHVSEGMRDMAIDHRIGLNRKHFIVHSGMDLDRYRRAAPLTHAELSLLLGLSIQEAANAQIVLMVSLLEPRKRVAEFLEVFASLCKMHPGARLVVLGQGGEERLVRERASMLGIENRVHLLGFRTDVERWITSAAVCVMASVREGMPRALVQSALGGRAAVAPALPGLDAVIRNGQSGFLVPVESLAQMLEPISRLLSDEFLRTSFGETARTLDLSSWGIDAMISGIDAAYASVLENRRERSTLREQ